MAERRDFLKTLGLGGGSLALGGASFDTLSATLSEGKSNPEADRLHEEMVTFPIDDTHCHPLTDEDAKTTPQKFLQRLSLAAFPVPNYFPAGIYERWQQADAATRRKFDKQYGIQSTLSEITYHFGESVFVKYMVKEMAQFLQCAPTLDAVINARNSRGSNYWQYVNSLFRDVKIENVMLDTGYAEGMGAAGIDRLKLVHQGLFHRHMQVTRSTRLQHRSKHLRP